MGNIPINIDNTPQAIPTIQTGSNKGFGMQAIEAQAIKGQNIARLGQTIAGTISAIGQYQNKEELIKSKEDEKELKSAYLGDMAKYEQRREAFDNQRIEALGKTKDVKEIQAIYAEYDKNIQGLFNDDVTDEEGIPLFRTRKSKEDAINSWRKNKGDVDRQRIIYLQQLNKEADIKRVASWQASMIQNTDNPADEAINAQKIKENNNSLYELGHISAEDRDIQTKTALTELRNNMVTNQLSKLSNNLSSGGFEVALKDFDEAIMKRSDISDAEKKAYIDLGKKYLHNKQMVEKADMNMKKAEQTKRWTDNANSIMAEMGDDGTLPQSNDELRDYLNNDMISTEFFTNIVTARANRKAKINIGNAKAEEQGELINNFQNVWGEVQAYDPNNDPDKSKYAKLVMKIAPYDTEYSSTLMNELKGKTIEGSSKPTDKAISSILKVSDEELKAKLGIGFRTEKGKKKEAVPTGGEFKRVTDKGFFWDTTETVKYQERLRSYNSIKSDLLEAAKSKTPAEMQEYIDNHPQIKKLRSEHAAKAFFTYYQKPNDKSDKMNVVPEGNTKYYKKTRKVKDPNTGKIYLVDENNKIIKEVQ